LGKINSILSMCGPKHVIIFTIQKEKYVQDLFKKIMAKNASLGSGLAALGSTGIIFFTFA